MLQLENYWKNEQKSIQNDSKLHKSMVQEEHEKMENLYSLFITHTETEQKNTQTAEWKYEDK